MNQNSAEVDYYDILDQVFSKNGVSSRKSKNCYCARVHGPYLLY